MTNEFGKTNNIRDAGRLFLRTVSDVVKEPLVLSRELRKTGGSLWWPILPFAAPTVPFIFIAERKGLEAGIIGAIASWTILGAMSYLNRVNEQSSS